MTETMTEAAKSVSLIRKAIQAERPDFWRGAKDWAGERIYAHYNGDFGLYPIEET